VSQFNNVLLSTKKYKKQREYWINELQDLEARQPFIASNTGIGDKAEYVFSLNEELTAQLLKLSKNSDISLFVILLSAFLTFLYKYTNENDLLAAIPVYLKDEQKQLFNEMVVLRKKAGAKENFKDFLLEVRKSFIEICENQEYPFKKIIEELNYKAEQPFNWIFDLVFASEDLHKLQNIEKGDSKFTAVYRKANDKITFTFYYSASIEKSVIERTAIYYESVIGSVLNNISIRLNDIKLLTEEEKSRILYDFNNTKEQLPKDKPVHQLFEEQAVKAPGKIAVEDNGRQITYDMLNRKANQLARALRGKGAGQGSIVCIIMENCIETIVGILGVLKAGGAYLPIDPVYRNRIPYILEDSAADIILTNGKTDSLTEYNKQVIRLDDEKVYTGNETNLDIDIRPDNLAYILYTSGTTGNPKGVMIEHHGVYNYIWYAAQKYVRNENITFPLYTSISFDLTVTSIFTPLITGNKIIVYRGEKYDNLVSKILEDNRVGIIKLTPSHLKLVRDKKYPDSKLKRIIVGGEELETQLAQDIYDNFGGNIELHNEYGPTETVVGCMDYIFNPDNDKKRTVSIGSPIYNTEIYVLDRNLEPVPYDVSGEIYISGEGVGRGYSNLPELTNESFLQNPFVSGRRMYKTGDLGRITPDGLIEFYGRIDNQVSIRGYRIELGEIESQLLKHPEIKEAVVTVRSKDNEKCICAYIIADKELHQPEIRKFLMERIPDYMIPAYVVKIDKIPLTETGKINTYQLNAVKLISDSEYEAPKTELEKQLVTIWQKVLGKDHLGINDNFQYIGGDSIKAIGIYAEMSKLNLKANFNDIFLYPTIKEFSKCVSREDTFKAEQGLVTGEVCANPIQRMLFSDDLLNINHFNLSHLFYKKDGFNTEIVNEVMKKIVEHHDYLRAAFYLSDDRIMVANRGLEGNLFELEIIECQEDTEEEFLRRVQSVADSKHVMDLKNGPLVRMVLFKCLSGEKYLFITISHLVSDLISWSILADDFILGYTQLEQNQKIKLPQKTTSFKTWMDKIQKYAESGELLAELKYWENILEEKTDPLPKDYEVNKDKRRKKNLNTATINFDEKTTSQIVEDTCKFYNASIKTILLTAFGMALKEWKELQKVLVEFEGHGREEIFKDVNLNRTIGFFTQIYPVILELPHSKTISEKIKFVENTLEQIPNNGIGYGILKYITPLHLKKESDFAKSSEIAFNYMGETRTENKRDNDLISESSFRIETNVSAELVKPYSVEVIGSIVNGKLQFHFIYNIFAYNAETIEKLAALYKKCINELIFQTKALN